MEDARWEALVATTTALLRDVARRRSTITYRELREAVGGADLVGRGRHDLAALLRAVSARSDDAGRGLLSAVVVRADGMPGGGFFRLAFDRGRVETEPRALWLSEVHAVFDAAAPA